MDLTHAEQMLLQAIAAALRGEKVTWQSVTAEEWTQFTALAIHHKVQPLVFDAVYACPAVKQWAQIESERKSAKHLTVLQTLKTAEFLSVYAQLTAAGLQPIVLKGILCRALYPNGDLRQSADEDIFLTGEDFEKACEIFRTCGMQPTSVESVETAEELGWRKKDSYLYIELHRRLFDGKSAATRVLEPIFDGAGARAEWYDCGSQIYSLSAHDHLLYLLLHAYKHFIHSGFGIRQIADVGLWARHYSDKIDTEKLYNECEAAHILKFAAAVFRIAKNHLAIELELPPEWKAIQVDEMPMLLDLLHAGVYGTADKNREHSAGVTLNAVAAKQSNRKNNLLRIVFPKRKALECDYPELKRHGILLPYVWVKRLLKYRKETKNGSTGSAAEAWKLAQERKNLLKTYDIL